ncbi:hypothetical protein SISNIDRAFT_202379 [Sistotremastrum niveocremeum HHB9708]|uniref:Uncharacterized protein n=1 Tax=Sistotremastrum niveocremeum HHB9708 TaxID=1314777 RepID=A0A164ZQX2_9AGAM|nr:hypothetical protein SISNIDRAFT_202379 [Sistotremastrum niveocremeum HHB9708]
MRRFVALFAKNKSSDNRKDKHNSPHPPPSDPPSSISSVRKRPSKVLPNSPLNLHPPHPPSLRQGSFGNTSSSSSDVSSPSAPHTPDDDPRNAKKWKIWSGSGSQNSSKLSNTSLKTPSIVVPDDQWPALTTEWVPPDDAAFLRPASRQAPQPPPPVPSSFGQARKSTPSVASSDNEESESESEESDEFAGPVTVPISTPPRRSLVLTSTNTAQPTLPRPPPSRLNPASYTKLHALTLASLIPTPSPPPLLHFPSAPLFPRSSNPPHSLSSEPSLLSILHKKHILRRLESRNLTPLEEASIASFADRPRVSPRPPPPKIPEAMSDVKRLDSYSRGLHRWIYRPCFEERVSVWTMSVDGYDIVKDRVTGSGTAVLDLEFSPGLEALAGYGSSDLEEDTGAIISPAFTTTPSSGCMWPFFAALRSCLMF